GRQPLGCAGSVSGAAWSCCSGSLCQRLPGRLGLLLACLGVRVRRGLWWVLSWEVGVVERRSEEQGVEAGSSATQLAVRQSVVPLLRQPHPPRLETELCLFSGWSRRVRRFGLPRRAAGSGGDAESGGWLRSVGEIGAQRAVDQVREPSF